MEYYFNKNLNFHIIKLHIFITQTWTNAYDLIELKGRVQRIQRKNFA